MSACEPNAQGLPARAIADITGIPIATVQHRFRFLPANLAPVRGEYNGKTLNLYSREATQWMQAWSDRPKATYGQAKAARIQKQIGAGIVPDVITVPLARAKRVKARPKRSKKFQPREYLHIKQIAERVGRSQWWTVKRLADMGISEAHDAPKPTSRARMFDAAVVGILLKNQLPYSDDWYSIPELMQLTGWKETTVIHRLKHLNPEMRRSALTGRDGLFYPPTALKVIEDWRRAAPAGDWLSKKAIARVIRRHTSWVSSRITKYVALAEWRLDDSNNLQLHYPPLVLQELQKQSLDAPRRKTARREDNEASSFKIIQPSPALCAA